MERVEKGNWLERWSGGCVKEKNEKGIEGGYWRRRLEKGKKGMRCEEVGVEWKEVVWD